MKFGNFWIRGAKENFLCSKTLPKLNFPGFPTFPIVFPVVVLGIFLVVFLLVLEWFFQRHNKKIPDFLNKSGNFPKNIPGFQKKIPDFSQKSGNFWERGGKEKLPIQQNLNKTKFSRISNFFGRFFP